MQTSPQAAAHTAAPVSRRLLAWAVDSLVISLTVVGGVVALDALLDPSPTATVVVLLGLVTLLPFAIGMLSARRRTLGCLIVGTAFFHEVAGRRATRFGMGRVVLLRWWLPALGVLWIMSLFDGGGADWDSVHEQRLVRGGVRGAREPRVARP